MEKQTVVKIRAYMSILFATFLWGSIAIFYKGLTAAHFLPQQVVAIRVLIAAVLMVLYAAVRCPLLLRIHLCDWWVFGGTGIASFAFFNYCYFRAMDLRSVSVAAILMNTAPVFIVLISAVVFHERLTGRKLIALCVAMFGCMLSTGILTQPQPISAGGIVFGVLTGFGYGLYSIFGTAAVKRGYSSFTISLYTFLFAAAAMLPLALPTMSFTQFHIASIGNLVGISVFGTVLPYLFYTYGLSRVDSGSASIVATMEVVFTTLVGVVIFGEKLTWEIIAGIVFITLAVTILGAKQTKKN